MREVERRFAELLERVLVDERRRHMRRLERVVDEIPVAVGGHTRDLADHELPQARHVVQLLGQGLLDMSQVPDNPVVFEHLEEDLHHYIARSERCLSFDFHFFLFGGIRRKSP